MGGTKGRLSVEPGPWQVGEVPGPRQGWHTGSCLAEPGPTWELSLWPTEGSGKGRSSDEPELGITVQGVPAKVTVTKAL